MVAVSAVLQAARGQVLGSRWQVGIVRSVHMRGQLAGDSVLHGIAVVSALPWVCHSAHAGHADAPCMTGQVVSQSSWSLTRFHIMCLPWVAGQLCMPAMGNE